ncbi:MAG: prepilin-type N-terminal cleavage/methylation domain-containing protein [Candidatus Paceibacterota bacterium]|jgi:prepilin-type N-terminal cleavage/methylation domain-containing protein
MWRNSKKQTYNQGFSILELVIVLAVISILVSMIVPSFGKVGGSEALDTTTVSIIAVLNEAKSQAVSSQNATSSGVRIFNNKLVSFKGNYGNLNKETSLSNLIGISTSTGLGADIIFSNVTGESNASGTITITVLREPTKTNTIRIYSTGVIEKN